MMPDIPEETDSNNAKQTPLDPADLGYELDAVSVCGLSLSLFRRRSDFFAACAGDLPIMSTGVVLWECGVLLADYLGYARWVDVVGRPGSDACQTPWWQLHPPAAVVPSRFWSGRSVLELGGGCGLVTIALASLGADVVYTDGDPAALRTAERNAAQARARYSKEWGSVKFAQFNWDDTVVPQRLAREHGPFEFVVGSDLLYGDRAPPGALVDALVALAQEPGSMSAQVILAVKNRCADETVAFRSLIRQRSLWEFRLADPENFLEGFHGPCLYEGGTGPAYNIVHLVPHRSAPDPAVKAGGDHSTATVAVRASELGGGDCAGGAREGAAGAAGSSESGDEPAEKRLRVVVGAAATPTTTT